MEPPGVTPDVLTARRVNRYVRGGGVPEGRVLLRRARVAADIPAAQRAYCHAVDAHVFQGVFCQAAGIAADVGPASGGYVHVFNRTSGGAVVVVARVPAEVFSGRHVHLYPEDVHAVQFASIVVTDRTTHVLTAVRSFNPAVSHQYVADNAVDHTGQRARVVAAGNAGPR